MNKNKITIALALAALMASPVADGKSYKRGVSENRFQYHAQIEAVGPGVTWFYNWANTLGAYIADQEHLEFVPMVWNGNFSPDNIRKYAKEHPDCKYLLGFNEPNFKSQANMTPQVAAQRWPEVKALADELGLKLVAPALNYSPDAPYTQPTVWMDEFVKLVGSDAFDFTAIHFYGGLGGMKDLATTFHERYGKPVWVTEFCYWPGEMGDVSVDSQLNSMVETVEWLEKTEWIYRYAWFKATEESRANFKLVESGRGEDARELTELGYVYLYMSTFDADKYYEVGETVAASNYINRQFAMLGKGANPDCPEPIEISTFNSGATVDYQFDIPSDGDYNIELTVSGFGEPTRFDPKLSVVTVNPDGTESAPLTSLSFGLPNSNTDYKSVLFPTTLKAGKQTIRFKDENIYAPSGLRISTVKVADMAGIDDVAADNAVEGLVDVVNLQGVVLRRGVSRSEAINGLPAGLYIVGGEKTLVK